MKYSKTLNVAEHNYSNLRPLSLLTFEIIVVHPCCNFMTFRCSHVTSGINMWNQSTMISLDWLNSGYTLAKIVPWFIGV